MVTATTTDQGLDKRDVIAALQHFGMDDAADDVDAFMAYVRDVSGEANPSLCDVEDAIYVKKYDLTGVLSPAI